MNGPMPPLDETTLDAWFSHRARMHADRAALHVAGHDVTYAELDARRRRLGAALAGAGLGDARGRIALLSPKCTDAYAALLAIMGSGNVYVPLNPSHPEERLRSISRAADFDAWIVHVDCLALFGKLVEPGDDPIVLQIGTPAAASAASIGRALARQHGCEVAYLMFTSGTTGVPKGVPVTHANALALLRALREALSLTPADRMTHFPELTFDFSMGEILACWDAGACLYVATASDLRSPSAFVRCHGLTVWSSVPTLAAFARERARLSFETMPSLRLSIFCGEAMATSLAKDWHTLAPVSRILNLYGPTEVTVFATVFDFDPDVPPDMEWLPIGMPLQGVEAQVAGPNDAALNAGEVGELWLSGPQVFPGYWNTSPGQRTCFAFDPHTGAKWYRTGDRAAWHERWGFVFHGRQDRQTKVRGFRVELQDVEAALRRLLPATELAVVTSSGDIDDDVRLIAFLEKTPSAEELRSCLPRLCAELLPFYMVPSAFELVEGLPLNSNGKINLPMLQSRARSLAGRRGSDE